jgi:hypothetical protein
MKVRTEELRKKGKRESNTEGRNKGRKKDINKEGNIM